MLLAALNDLEILGQSRPDQDFQGLATHYAATVFMACKATMSLEFVINRQQQGQRKVNPNTFILQNLFELRIVVPGIGSQFLLESFLKQA